MEPFAPNEVRITVIGGGTGSFTLLGALKNHTSQLAAIVNMADDGGSSGVLRDELGALPAGDIRQCLVALSDSPRMRDLFSYRFDRGTFGGHSFGNIFLTALEQMTGEFSQAVEIASEVLRVNGTVIPATLDDVRLVMAWPGAGSLVLRGERVIDAEFFRRDPRKATLTLEPTPSVNPIAIAAIEQADIVVIAPGDLYTSLGPLLVIDGIGQALRQTRAKVVYVNNLVTKAGQTTGFTVFDHASEIERFAGGPCLDAVIYNSKRPDAATMQRYKEEGAEIVKADRRRLEAQPYTAIAGQFLDQPVTNVAKVDGLGVRRNLIRHNPERVAKAIINLATISKRK